MLENAPPYLSRLNGMNGDECSDFKNRIGRPAKAGLSGNSIFLDKLTILRREFCVKNIGSNISNATDDHHEKPTNTA